MIFLCHVTFSCWRLCSLSALLLLDQYRQKSRLFRSPVLFVPLGDDFRFVESSEWDAQFHNYQKLFDYFDQHPHLHVKVSAWYTWGDGAEAVVGGTPHSDITVESAVWHLHSTFKASVSLNGIVPGICVVRSQVLLLLLVLRLSSGPCQITSRLSSGVWAQQEQRYRPFAGTSSRTPTVTTITGADTSPPDRFTNVWTECWRPRSGTIHHTAFQFIKIHQ